MTSAVRGRTPDNAVLPEGLANWTHSQTRLVVYSRPRRACLNHYSCLFFLFAKSFFRVLLVCVF